MKKPTVIIVMLLLGLVGSNLWWAYRLLDAGVSYTYQSESLRMTRVALQQSLAIIKAAALPDATRKSVLAAAMNNTSASEPFEKEGYIWIGSIGLRFSENGQLREAVPAWSPFP